MKTIIITILAFLSLIPIAANASQPKNFYTLKQIEQLCWNEYSKTTKFELSSFPGNHYPEFLPLQLVDLGRVNGVDTIQVKDKRVCPVVTSYTSIVFRDTTINGSDFPRQTAYPYFLEAGLHMFSTTQATWGINHYQLIFKAPFTYTSIDQTFVAPIGNQ